jgi:hypothetical protein
MPLLYATTDELATWVAPAAPPADGGALLRTASALVADAIAASIYAADRDGYPSNPGVRGAVRDATLAQAGTWAATGIRPGRGADQVARPVQSKSLSGGGQSVTYGSGDAALLALASGTSLTDEALGYLRRAGLLQQGGRVRDARAVGYRAPVSVREYDPLTGQLL